MRYGDTTMKTKIPNLRHTPKLFATKSALPLLAVLFSYTPTLAFSSNSNSNSNINSNSNTNTRKGIHIHNYNFLGTNHRKTMSLMMETDELAVQANSYASANGIQVERRKTNSENDETPSTTTYFEGAPMSLLPNAYPQIAFHQAREVAPYFNELVDRVSRDAGFLEENLGGGVSTMDPYTAQILRLYKDVYVDQATRDEFALSADRLGILRSDYMLHKDGGDDDNNDYGLKQVELNTIASSFAGLSCKIANLHRYLTSRFDTETRDFLRANAEKVQSSSLEETMDGVPLNPALKELPLAMKVAYDRYVERFGTKDSDDDNTKQQQQPVVLFVVQEGETNTVDQRLLEFALWEDHGIPVVRRSLTKLDSELSLEDGTLKLSSENNREVAVVYFRAGYAPTDYPGGDNGAEWRARKTLETSKATKCPCLGYHLAGTKKVQQELARPGVLEKFFPNEASKVTAMRSCFAGLYSMGDDATDDDRNAAKDVLDGGHARYVLKPQREGGGYNFYGEDLAKKLRDNVSRNDENGTIELGNELGEYILMERLFPPQQTAILMRGGKIQGSGESISELGAFGTLVVDSSGTVVHNHYAGFLLRTKFSNVDEGGVASGFATLSSPYLCRRKAAL